MSDEITPNPQTPQTEPSIEPISEPAKVTIPSEPEIPTVETEPTAQIPVNEPLNIPTETEAEPITETIQTETKSTETEIQPEPISETIIEPVKEEIKPVETTPEELPPSASLPEEKPMASSESKTTEPETIETKVEPEKEISETKSESKQETKPDPEPEKPKVIPVIISTKSKARELLIKARNAIQSRKRKKLNKVMTLFAKQTKITNDEIEKFLHVSDATATRYLSQLEKEGKIKQTGKTGRSVFYTKN